MPHGKSTSSPKLSIKRDQRAMLIKNLATSVVLYEKVTTTKTKAKMVKGYLDSLLSKAVNSKAEKREIYRYLKQRLMHDKAVKKVMEDLKPRLAGRTGGYVSVLNAGFRHGDGAPISVIRLMLSKPTAKPSETTGAAKTPGKTITGKEKVTVKRSKKVAA